MAAPHEDTRRVTIHLSAEATVEFSVDQLWPHHGEYARFGTDLAAFAEEVSRRLRTESCIGYSLSPHQITLIPINAIMRIDFTESLDVRHA